MRRLVWLIVFALILWCGWWVIAAQSLSREVTNWFDARRAAGWQADLRDVTVSGFPFRLVAKIDAPVLGDPSSGLAFSSSALALSSPAWWPGHVTADLPSDGIYLATPRQNLMIFAEGAQIDLRLKPGNALEVESLSLQSKVAGVLLDGAEAFSLEAVQVQLQQDEKVPAQYSLRADATELRPAEKQRSALRVPEALPDAYDSLLLEMEVLLSRPIDRQTLETARPQPREIALTLAEAVWGPMEIRTSADLAIDPQGRATGELSFQARQWQDMLALLESANLLATELRPQFENILSMLAQGSGNPDTLDVALEARDGRLFFGFFPIAELAPLQIP